MPNFYRERAVFYLGHFYEDEEFIQVVNELFVNVVWTDKRIKRFGLRLDYKNFILPEQFSLFTYDDWVEYLDVEIV
jgi:hypothetical protein